MFPSELTELRDTNNPTVLFCGAGISIGAVPGSKDLYENDHEKVEQYLGLDGAINHGKFTGLSEDARLDAWADEVLAELDRRKEPLTKLRFADARGLLDEPCWWGRVEIDFRGNRPRHRVMARFAKEGLWHSIWSFNRDCILENTLEQIGLSDCEPRFDSPWMKSHYNTHVHSVYFPCSKHPRTLNIHKPAL